MTDKQITMLILKNEVLKMSYNGLTFIVIRAGESFVLVNCKTAEVKETTQDRILDLIGFWNFGDGFEFYIKEYFDSLWVQIK